MPLVYTSMWGYKSARKSSRFRWFGLRSKRSCLFLDADGVLWEDQGPGTILKLPKVSLQASRMIKLFSQKRRHLIIVITNQTSAARGQISLVDLQALIVNFFSRLQNHIRIDAVYACFHHPTAQNRELQVNCTCRKPSPELLFEATKTFDIDLTRSLFVGDRITDVIAANRAGVSKVFLLVNSKMYETNVQGNLPIVDERSSFTFFPVGNLAEVDQYISNKNETSRKLQ